MKLWLFILLLPAAVFGQEVEYRNLVMEGGGVRGLAYAGALQILEERGILSDLENVGGSSAGAIAGLMVALNYSTAEIDSILQQLKIQEFNDGKFLFGRIRRIKNQYGMYKGEKFEQWLAELIENKTGSENTTFSDLHEMHLKDKRFKDFYCTATNISSQRLEILSWKEWPQMKLRTAVHISSCIPFYFVPVAIDSMGNEVSESDSSRFALLVDGGMLCNYPINMFDSCEDGANPLVSRNVVYNMQTIGLKLERAEQVDEFGKNRTDIAPFDIRNMKDYSSAVMNLMMETLNRKSFTMDNEKGRTIYISYGDISGRPRKMSHQKKKVLYENGLVAAKQFFMSNSETAR